ncbi:MAG: ferric reductase-like transmembrane domain-containing protein [Sandaracinaceae bacterium]
MTRRGDVANYVYGATGIATVGALLYGSLPDWPMERSILWSKATGWVAIGALALALCASPVGAALGWWRRRSFAATTAEARRALGIASAVIAIIHLTIGLTGVLAGELERVLTIAWVRAGAGAVAILLPLVVTSFPTAVRVLRVRLWKPLHRLAYVAGVLAVQHALLAPMSDGRWVIALAAVVLAIAPLRLLRRRPRSADRDAVPGEQPMGDLVD